MASSSRGNLQVDAIAASFDDARVGSGLHSQPVSMLANERMSFVQPDLILQRPVRGKSSALRGQMRETDQPETSTAANMAVP